MASESREETSVKRKRTAEMAAVPEPRRRTNEMAAVPDPARKRTSEVPAVLDAARKRTSEFEAVADPADEVAALKAQVTALEAATAAKDRRIQAMKEIGTSLGAMLNLDDVLALIMTHVTELLEADRSTLYLLDSRNKELWSKIAQGDNVQDIRLPVGVGVAGWVAKTGLPLNLRDVYADKRFNQAVDKRTGYKTHTMVAFPMRDHRGNILGVLQALNKKVQGGFSDEDERTLEAIACQAAAAIENAVLYKEAMSQNQALSTTRDELSRKLGEFDLLFEFTQAAARARDQAAIITLLLERATSLLGAEGAMILRMDGPGASLVSYALDGGDGRPATKTVMADPAEGLIGWVAHQAQPLLVADAAKDKRHSKPLARRLDITVKNACGVPLLTSEGACDGAVMVYNHRATFNEEHVVLLTMLANHAAKALEAARIQEEDEKARRLQTIGQMLSGVVHDFKTPMTIISGYVQLMAGSKLEPEREEYAELVMKQFDALSQMTRDLLQFARGEVEVLLRKIYVAPFMQEMDALLERIFDGSNVTHHVEARFKGTVRMDPGRMQRVVTNIARNAREAMPDGGKFTFSVEQQGESVLFKFQDTGPGIPEALEGRLFTEFATHGKEGGTGLGLAVVKRIVQEHRGDVTYESRKGKGTTFIVRLPL